MKKAILIVMFFTIISKILGLLRDVILANYYGASNISDIYLISITISTILFGMIAQSSTTSYIPMFKKVEIEKGTKEANYFTSSLVNFSILISFALILIGIIFTEEILFLFASGFVGETKELAISFTRIMMIVVLINHLFLIFSGYLQIKKNFIIPALVGVPFNIILIYSIFLSEKYNIYYLPWGYVFAFLSQLFLLIPFVLTKSYKHKIKLKFNDENIKKVLILSIPVILGSSINQINLLIDRTIASQIIEGGISALSYANRLTGFIQGLCVLSVATVFFPTISQLAAEKKWLNFKVKLQETLILVSIIVIPSILGFVIFAKPILGLLFGRGAFDQTAINMTVVPFIMYSIGMLAFGYREILSRAYYSLQDTKTPMVNAAIGVTINIILNIILSKYYGLPGLAAATSISAIITSLLLFFNIFRKEDFLIKKYIFIVNIKVITASSITGVLSYSIFIFLLNKYNEIFSLFIVFGFALLLYFLLLVLFRIRELDTIITFIRKILNKQSFS